MPYGSWLPENISATAKGTVAIKNLGLNFAYPKPVELLAFILRLATNKTSLVLDFFAGSGTTLHAVNLLNAQDGGNRRCILVTNNEVSDAGAKTLRKQGLTPADDAWQALGTARRSG